MIARQPADQMRVRSTHAMSKTKLNRFCFAKLAMIAAAAFGNIMKHRRQHQNLFALDTLKDRADQWKVLKKARIGKAVQNTNQK